MGSAIIEMYAKNLLISVADEVFDEMPMRNTVCANALLARYGKARMWVHGLELLWEMHDLDSALLRACASLSC